MDSVGAYSFPSGDKASADSHKECDVCVELNQRSGPMSEPVLTAIITAIITAAGTVIAALILRSNNPKKKKR